MKELIEVVANIIKNNTDKDLSIEENRLNLADDIILELLNNEDYHLYPINKPLSLPKDYRIVKINNEKQNDNC